MKRFRRGAIISGAALVAIVVGALVWWWFPGRNLGALRNGPPPGFWAAWERQENEWKSRGLDRRIENRYVDLEQISIELQLAVLVSEDIEYFDHGAVDWTAVGEAIDEWRDGGRLRGASTISQQLVKSLYLSNERTAWRKLRQVRLASRLEDELSKRRIFELYLNVVEFGPGLLGAEAAATRYYKTAALCLDPEQAAGLAAALPSPGRDNPDTTTDLWKARRELIMRRMTAAGWLRHKLEALNRYAIPDAG